MRVIACALGLLGYRLMRAPCVDRVGHLALDFDSYLKERHLLSRRSRPLYLMGDRGSSRSGVPANAALMEYWQQYISMLPSGVLSRILGIVRDRVGQVDDLADYAFNINTRARAYEIQNRWNGRPPLLLLFPAHRDRGEHTLRQMGLPDDAWFVCLHAREGGYSSGDEHHHSYRNVDIASYNKAMTEIVSRGGWCIRMGDASMTPIEPTPGVVDYALSPFKSDWMDVYLCASCRFFLGDNSGLFNVSGVFGRMSVLTNTVPMVCGYSPFVHDLSIPKQMIRNGVRLTFQECFSAEIGKLRLTPEFENAGISFVDNTDDEIADLIREAFDRLAGTATYTEEDELLQDHLRRLVQPEQCCWQAASRIGREYLRSRADELLVASATRA